MVDEGKYHKIVGKPSQKLGDLLLEHYNLKDSAALIKGNAVSFNSEVHTLFGETDYNKCLTITTDIDVYVEVVYLVLESETFKFNMKANSTIKDVIKSAKPHFQVSVMNGGTVQDEYITVQNNNQEITDWSKLAVDCQLNSPFLISKQHYIISRASLLYNTFLLILRCHQIHFIPCQGRVLYWGSRPAFHICCEGACI